MLRFFSFVMMRFRFPFSRPDEVAEALGVDLPRCGTIEGFITHLLQKGTYPRNLMKNMNRKEAESFFNTALKKEHFKQKTLISYLFSQGWLELMLLFDDNGKLRRMYIYHKATRSSQGVEIPLI